MQPKNLKGDIIMLNNTFIQMDKASRELKIRNIIRSKARGISDENLNQILAAINLDQQYTVTGSSNYDALQRNAYEEDGGDKYQVKIQVVYGLLSPGLVRDGIIWDDPATCNRPTAFIKNVKIFIHGEPRCQNSIFIYQNSITHESAGCSQ